MLRRHLGERGDDVAPHRRAAADVRVAALLAEQLPQLGAVLAHPAFAANPVDTIFEHLANTLPPPPAAAAPTRGKKKRQQR